MRTLLYDEENGRRKDERDKIRSDKRLKKLTEGKVTR
jgi:hypothetical protein